jgi:hypothetical protein
VKRSHWLLLIALLSVFPSFAQTSAPEPTPPQKSTDELKPLLIKAYQHNTIASITGPYHLLASFETFSPDGKSSGKGSIERWSIAPTRQKTVTHFRDHTMTDYFVDGKHHYTDDGFDGTITLYRVYQSIFNSMPLPRGWELQQPEYKPIQSEDAPMDCALYQFSIPESSSPIQLKESFCLSHETHEFVLTQAQLLSTAYTDYAPFQEKSIARTISIAADTATRASIHLQQLDEAMPADTAMLPPADASPVSPGPEWLETTRDEDRPRHRVEPHQIKSPTAVLVLRSRSGKIEDIEPIAGPASTIQNVIDALKNWTYAPLIREDNNPVETITAIAFDFPGHK